MATFFSLSDIRILILTQNYHFWLKTAEESKSIYNLKPLNPFNAPLAPLFLSVLSEHSGPHLNQSLFIKFFGSFTCTCICFILFGTFLL